MRNRLCGSSEQTGSLDKLHDSDTDISRENDSFLSQQVCFFGPESYEPRYDYPLIVWLHSCDSSELELANVMPELSMRNYVSCAPRGTVRSDVEGNYYHWGQSAAAIAIAEEIVFETIALAGQHFSVSNKKVFLAGVGSGGTTAWRLGLRYPKRFAGVISIGGDFPYRNQPLMNMHDARNLATLWLYGAHSKICGVEQVCQTLPLLHAAKLQADVRQYPCGNDLLANMLEDMNKWVMEQVTQQPAGIERVVEESFSEN